MNKWLRNLSTRSLLTVLIVSVSAVASAETVLEQPPVTQETKAELTELRGQLGSIKQKEHHIRQLNHQMRDNRYELRQLLHDGGDKGLHAQVEQELQSFHKRLNSAYVLHKQGEALKKKIQAARSERDLKRLRTLTGELERLKGKQLELLRMAHQDLKGVLERVRKHVR
ncbi:hypothetical protein CIG75_08230 [Tumebacillus algifaecis]|uniref:Uncharacterized protein n=1 Tax=Tumebacillus algifaecis TaxID=1214604 RepID=A0A223D0H8_9BACL|nr:hypothetical protein [Tumebacillus algifaecis]ASS74975.1 hypothetical protein CIG75_08230 [Tumebacillus algifaecis]